MIDPILLSVVHLRTWRDQQLKTNATGFFFSRNDRLYLVTSRHVMIDDPSQHFPDAIEIELHIDAGNMAAASRCTIPLYRNGEYVWRQGQDTGGDVDVAVLEIDKSILPDGVVYFAFTPDHLPGSTGLQIEVGSSLLVAGFPLGFHDTLHHMPVVRHAVLASSFGLRFQGEGYFLTDARTHRGTSGAPVIMRDSRDNANNPLHWYLLGVHSARFDMGTRDMKVDEALGLNCAWYADILMTLTAD